MTDYSTWKVTDLKAELKRRGIPQTGLHLKQQIIDRLTEEDQEIANAAAAPADLKPDETAEAVVSQSLTQQQGQTQQSQIPQSLPPQIPPRASGSSRTNTSTGFSQATKLKVKELVGDKCWACHAANPQISHIVALEDRAISQWTTLGLIDFPIESYLNGIPLCPTCHNQFDHALDPGFSFIPTDLEFFIKFELEDRIQRRASGGQPRARKVPNADAYLAHQVQQGLVDSAAIGGLYEAIFLKDYFGLVHPDPALKQPRPWHGAPLAALRRAFPILGTGNLKRLSLEQRGQLQKLRDLYFDDDDTSHAAQTGDSRPGLGKRGLDTEDPDPDSPRKKLQISERKQSDVQKIAPTSTAATDKNVQSSWSLGPNLSTNDAVAQFSHLLHS